MISKVRFKPFKNLNWWEFFSSLWLLSPHIVSLRSASDSFSVSARFDTSQIHQSLLCSRTSHIPFMLQQRLPGWSPCHLSPLPQCVLYSCGQMKYPHCPPEVTKLNSSTWQSPSPVAPFPPTYLPTKFVLFSSPFIYSSPAFCGYATLMRTSFLI